MKEVTYEEAEKGLFPTAWKLDPVYTNIDGNDVKGNEKGYLSYYKLLIIDEEIDPVEITIHHGYMEVNTDNYTHLTLSERQLEFMNDAYTEAQYELEKSRDEWSKDFDKLNI